MREWRKKVKRILVLLLIVALIGNTVDFPVFAVSAAENRETGLCRHHQSHTVECGYSEEDNMLCEYECRICPIEDLIAALPDEVIEDNAKEVRAQLDKILAFYRELTAEEQEQIDLTHCYELQEALDVANVSTPIDELTEGTVAKVETSDGTIVYIGESDFAKAFDTYYNYNNVTVTLLSDIQPGSIYMGDVQAKVHILNTCTLDLAGHTIANSDTTIYVWPSGNLTIKDSSSGKTGQVVSTGGAAILTQTGMVSLIGGTYTGNPTIDGKDSSTNVSSLLANYGTQTTPHYAYFDIQGNPIALEENQRELTDPVTVAECTNHVYTEQSYSHDTGSLKHTQICAACGTVEEVDCEYTEFGETYDTKVCACGATLTAYLTGADNLVYNGARQTPGATFMVDGVTPRDVANVKTYSYNKDAGTATLAILDAKGVFWGMLMLNFTIAKATPVVTWNGGSTQTLTYTGQEAAVTADVQLVNNETGTVSYSYAEQGSDSYTPGLPTDVGTYSVKASFAEEKNYVAAESEVMALTITPLAITVTPDNGQHKEYRADDPELTYMVSPSLFGNDKLTGALTYEGKDEGAIGNHEIVQGTLAAPSENYTLTVASGVMFEITKPSLKKAMVIVNGSFTYTGAAQVPTADQVKVTLNGTEIPSSQYKTSVSNNINAGEATVTIAATENGNYSGSASGKFNIAQAPLTITASDQEITYGQSIMTGRGLITWSELCAGDSLDTSGFILTASTEDVPGGNITPSAASIKNSDGKDVTGNYEITYVDGKLTINKADAEITVGTDVFNKTYGDPAFTISGVTDTNPEADVQYEVTGGTDVVSVSNGTVTIQNAGMTTITVSLPESSNYNAAESKTITVSVAKKGGYTVSEINKKYYYDKENAANISLAALLPQNCGTVTYGEPATSGDVTFTAVDVENGVLSYALAKGNINDEGTLTVPVVMRNYADIMVTVKVKLTEQIPVELKEGTEVTLVNNTLTYGKSLSNLEFNEAVFVDNDGDTVKGTLAWKEAAAKPNVETTSAVWVFTPDKPEYASLEGMTAIRVNKAVPTVSATPAVEGGVYNPSRVLEQSDLSGATVTGVDGKTLKGGWNWKDSNIVPAVNNSGYVAVFTPTDATNYETVTSTVTVNVTKAIPYIAELPTAAGITYGDTLNVSALSGGTVQYGNGTGQAGSGAGSTETVAGIFTWKESSTRPAVNDSGKTEYTVVFTPSDTINYETTECSVTLTVQKAVNAPNMPGSTMDVPNSCERVSDVPLPENWEWKASDQDTVLEVGKAVNAVAVYTGSDKGSYEKETVTITITRASCDHVAGEILYTGEGEKAPACGSDGLGHRECTKCGSVIETGIVIPALEHDYTDKVTKEPTTESEGIRTYTCSLCGNEYTESIPKLPEETHQHSYTESVTKEPTCKDTGIRTYTCSCGDSYTETIAAPGHHYLGRETKKPTTTAEGVMTYTCDHCGDTYTESIPKLPGTPSGNTSNQENKIPVKGEVISDAKSKAVYTVTQAGKTGGTVSYTKSADNKATSISVPNTVILNGISYKVTTIAQNAFKNNKKLTKVTIGNNITAIGNNAFYGCKKIKNVSMGTNVTTIGTKSFYKCTSLTKITIPAKVSRIGKQAFYGCKKLKTITIKTKKLTGKKVGSKAFKGIHSKATVKVPKSKLKIYKQMLKAKGIGSKVKVKK